MCNEKIDFNEKEYKLICGNSLEKLKELPDESIDCCVTSPPYFQLRDYGMEEQIGIEKTPELYIDNLVKVFNEVKRVLKKEGTLWVNIGDSYCNSNGFERSSNEFERKSRKGAPANDRKVSDLTKCGLKVKDRIGIPWMLAFALRNEGWYLRQDIIWCLSSGEYLYVKSQKGVMPMMIKDLVRLNPKTIQLWNGNKWVNVVSWQKNNFVGEKIEIILRSGERINCTDGHRWVLENGEEKIASELKIGDILKSCNLPDENYPAPGYLTLDTMWLIGLYLAEGSHSHNCIQISLNSDENKWIDKIKNIINYYGGSVTYTINGNCLNIRIYSRIFDSILKTYIGGKKAINKHLNNSCWKLSNNFLKELVNGYLDGDGYFDKNNNRYRIGFTRNYYLERDLRILASRLNASLTVKPVFSKCNGKSFPSFKGEWKWECSEHFNNKNRNEIIKIQKSKSRNFYDIEVDSEDHLFSLASGVLTHNCKPNPMPQSVKDRCTIAHEYIFLMSKSPKYYFDYEAIQEEANYDGRKDVMMHGSNKYSQENIYPDDKKNNTMAAKGHQRWQIKTNIKFGGNKYGDNDDKHYATKSGEAWTPKTKNCQYDGQTANTMHINRENGLKDEVYFVRNKRDVWTVPTKGYNEAHFATYPKQLIEPCILAGCPENGVVLDPFNGSGTTGVVAIKNNRKYVGIELNPDYIELTEKRFNNDPDFLQKNLF